MSTNVASTLKTFENSEGTPGKLSFRTYTRKSILEGRVIPVGVKHFLQTANLGSMISGMDFNFYSLITRIGEPISPVELSEFIKGISKSDTKKKHIFYAAVAHSNPKGTLTERQYWSYFKDIISSLELAGFFNASVTLPNWEEQLFVPMIYTNEGSLQLLKADLMAEQCEAARKTGRWDPDYEMDLSAYNFEFKE